MAEKKENEKVDWMEVYEVVVTVGQKVVYSVAQLAAWTAEL